MQCLAVQRHRSANSLALRVNVGAKMLLRHNEAEHLCKYTLLTYVFVPFPTSGIHSMQAQCRNRKSSVFEGQSWQTSERIRYTISKAGTLQVYNGGLLPSRYCSAGPLLVFSNTFFIKVRESVGSSLLRRSMTFPCIALFGTAIYRLSSL
jgi:hypothetical protein